MKTSLWADELAESVLDGVAFGGGPSAGIIASVIEDYVSENFTTITNWAFAAHCHYEWQAFQLAAWIKTLPPETVPETVRKCAEAKP